MRRRLGSLGGASVDVLTTVAVNMAIMGLGLVSGILTARALVPAERGSFLAVVLWSGVVSAYAMLGLEQSLVFGSEGRWSRAVSCSRLLRRRIYIQATIGSLIAVAMNLFLLEGTLAGSVAPALLGAVTVLLNSVAQLRLVPLLAAGFFTRWNVVRISSPIAYVAFLSVFALLDGLTITTGLCALALSTLTTTMLAFGLSRTPEVLETAPVDVDGLVTYGFRILLVGIPVYFSQRMDQLVLGLLMTPAVLGVYAVAVSVASMAEVTKLTVEQLLFPRYVRLGWRRRDVRVLAASVALGTALVGVAAVPLLRPAITFVYGSAYSSAAEPLPWLLVAVGARVGVAVLSAAVKAAGALGGIAWGASAALVTTAVGMVTLLPLWGGVGAAVAVMAGQIVSFVLMLVFLDRHGMADPQARVHDDA